MESIKVQNQATELNDIVTNLTLANSAIIDSERAAEENYQQALAKADKWQEKFELALQIRCIKLAHEALLRRNFYKEEARRLETFMDEQFAQRIENLATINDLNKLLVTFSNSLN